MTSFRSAIVCCLCCCLLGAGVASAQTIGPEVGKPLKAAQEAMQKKQWDAAMVRIKEAQAVSGKSAFEQYNINELQAYVLLRQGDVGGATRLYEQNLNSGQVPPGELGTRIKTLAQLNFQVKNYGKVIEYGNRWLKSSGANDPEAYELVAQSYYLQRDYRNAAKLMQGAIDAARRSGKPVKENWLLLKLNSLYSQTPKDEAAIIAAREQLVRNFPKQNYWKDLLEMQANSPAVEEDDRAKLNFFRLMLDLGVLSKPRDYEEMAQMAMETSVPGEAVTLIEEGFKNKVLETKEKERYVRLLKAAQARSVAAQQGLAEREKIAATATTGDADVLLGATYLSYGQADKAIATVQRGLKKGGMKSTDEAYMVLGRAYLQLDKKEEARRAFEKVPEDSKLATVANLWALRAQQS